MQAIWHYSSNRHVLTINIFASILNFFHAQPRPTQGISQRNLVGVGSQRMSESGKILSGRYLAKFKLSRSVVSFFPDLSSRLDFHLGYALVRRYRMFSINWVPTTRSAHSEATGRSIADERVPWSISALSMLENRPYSQDLPYPSDYRIHVIFKVKPCLLLPSCVYLTYQLIWLARSPRSFWQGI